MLRLPHRKTLVRFLKHRFKSLHPFEVQALLLNACNIRCSYCRYPEIKTDLMSTQQWTAIIRQLGNLGTIRIKFQGGEPTIRRDFQELCRTAQDSGMITAVITNGIRIVEDPGLLDDLDEVVVSIDSPCSQIHDKVRGAGTHEKAVQALELALSRRRRCYVVMVVTQENYPHLEQMLEFCEKRGVLLHAQAIMFGKEPFDGDAKNLELSPRQIRELHSKLADWKTQRRGLMFSANTYRRSVVWQDYPSLTRSGTAPSSCMAGRFYVHIEANGDVWPCGHFGGEFQPLNVIRDGLENSLLHTRVHNCEDCAVSYLNERKSVFALRPSAVLEVLRRG